MTNTQFSTAVHVLTELARNPDDVRSSAELATMIDSHPVVVRRMIKDLKLAGIVDSLRGADGGIRLAIAPSEISLSQIAELMDENMAFETHTILEDQESSFPHSILATLESHKRKLQGGALSYLDGITIKDVLEDAVLRSELADLVAGGLTDKEIRDNYHIEHGHLVPRSK